MAYGGIHRPEGVAHLAEHVRKYLIIYTVISLTLAIPVGYYTRSFTSANKPLFSNLVLFFAILTIYPSMVQLKTEGLGKSFGSWKAIVVSMIYVFILSPVIAFTLAPTLGNGSIGLGFVTANIVPASSASLGYVLIAGGSLELATALAVLSLVVAIPAIPIFLDIYSRNLAATAPIAPIMTSVIYILVLPFIVGQLTRVLLKRYRGSDFVGKTIKPHLSLATMMSMFALIFVLVDKEAGIIIARPEIVGYIIGYQTGIIVGLLLLAIVISHALRLSYEDHQSVAFISVTKNQSVAAAIATMALSSSAALAPAIIPMIQPVIAIIYIHLEKPIRRIFTFKRGGEHSVSPH